MFGDEEAAEEILRDKSRALDTDEFQWMQIGGYPQFCYGYRMNPSGGPMVGGECFIVDVRKRLCYKGSTAMPPIAFAQQIKLGRRAPM